MHDRTSAESRRSHKVLAFIEFGHDTKNILYAPVRAADAVHRRSSRRRPRVHLDSV